MAWIQFDWKPGKYGTVLEFSNDVFCVSFWAEGHWRVTRNRVELKDGFNTQQEAKQYAEAIVLEEYE